MSVKHPELVVAGAVAVCLPMVPGLLAGQISGSTAGERFLIALVGCWVIGSVLSWVISTYSTQSRRAEVMKLLEESGEARQGGGGAPSPPGTERAG